MIADSDVGHGVEQKTITIMHTKEKMVKTTSIA